MAKAVRTGKVSSTAKRAAVGRFVSQQTKSVRITSGQRRTIVTQGTTKRSS